MDTHRNTSNKITKTQSGHGRKLVYPNIKKTISSDLRVLVVSDS